VPAPPAAAVARSIFASASLGLVQSSFDSFLPFRVRSSRDRPVKALWPDRRCAGYAQV
jgi:hypothetical protein